MEYCNRVYGEEFNIEFIYSTPATFVDALRKEEIAWPTYSGDLFPYFDDTPFYTYNRFWSGYYTTRPNFKVQIRQASGVFHAASSALAKTVLKPDISEEEVAAVEAALSPAEDWVGVLQHHDAITGTHGAHVGMEYLAQLSKKLEPGRNAYAGAVYDRIVSELGVTIEGGASELRMCADKEMIDVAVGCKPLALEMGQGDEFYTVVHNPSARSFQDLVRIELPNDFFQAEVYNASSQTFVSAYAEILEQEHYNKDGNLSDSTYSIKCLTINMCSTYHCSC
jgi:hypothetical protein